MKTSHNYYFDKDNNRIVRYLGRTDFLSHDLQLILKAMGIEFDFNIPHINQSQHKTRDQYFKNRWIKNYLLKKYAKDIELYKIAEEEMKMLF
jgi:hypothetical protein